MIHLKIAICLRLFIKPQVLHVLFTHCTHAGCVCSLLVLLLHFYNNTLHACRLCLFTISIAITFLKQHIAGMQAVVVHYQYCYYIFYTTQCRHAGCGCSLLVLLLHFLYNTMQACRLCLFTISIAITFLQQHIYAILTLTLCMTK